VGRSPAHVFEREVDRRIGALRPRDAEIIKWLRADGADEDGAVAKEVVVMLNRDNQGGLMRRPQERLMRPYGPGGMGRWDPFREMEEMHRRMDDLFTQVFGITLPDVGAARGISPGSGEGEPDVDIFETDSEYVIHAFLPGIDQNDIDVQATETTIALSAETRSPFEQQGGSSQPSAPGAQQGQTGQAQEGASQSGSAQQAGPSAEAARQGPHTQHRQSRYSKVNRFQFAYTLPEEITPSEVRAQFRNGRLELHLPKANKTQNSGAVRIPINGSAAAGGTLEQGGAQRSLQQISNAPAQTPTAEGKPSASGGAMPETASQTHRRGGEQTETDQNQPSESQPAGGRKSRAGATGK